MVAIAVALEVQLTDIQHAMADGNGTCGTDRTRQAAAGHARSTDISVMSAFTLPAEIDSSALGTLIA